MPAPKTFDVILNWKYNSCSGTADTNSHNYSNGMNSGTGEDLFCAGDPPV